MSWKYRVDNSCLLCECDFCGKALIMSYYQDKNYYLFCPYCGQQQMMFAENISEKQKKAHGSEKDYTMR